MRRQTWMLTLLFWLNVLLPAAAQESDRFPDRPTPGWHRFGEQPPADSPSLPSPLTLTLPAGSWISVRADQPLSSDYSRPGDGFTATLSQPLIADGRVVARRGQTVGGLVAVAEK